MALRYYSTDQCSMSPCSRIKFLWFCNQGLICNSVWYWSRCCSTYMSTLNIIYHHKRFNRTPILLGYFNLTVTYGSNWLIITWIVVQPGSIISRSHHKIREYGSSGIIAPLRFFGVPMCRYYMVLYDIYRYYHDIPFHTADTDSNIGTEIIIPVFNFSFKCVVNWQP